VTLDLGGHGASGRNRSDWSIDNYAADVAAVARQLPAPPLVLVGHSMGGPVALAAATRIGDRVLGIIGVDTFKSIGLPPPSRSRIEHELAPFRTDFIGTMHSFVPEHLFAPGANPVFVRKVTDDLSRGSPAVAVASLASLNEMDFSTVLPRIHVPIIAINSDLGEATDEARIARAAPTFHLITLRGTGHFVMMEAPERFNPVLREQIAALAAGPRK
jgi:pimeloyl-ACP methyl ester carboxylesterase